MRRRAAFAAQLLPRAGAASVAGSVCGVVAFGALDLLIGWSSPSRSSGFLLWLTFLALGAFPFALAALLFAGLPLTFLLRGLAASRWLMTIAGATGAAAGWAVMALLDFRTVDPLQLIGALVGGFTALLWAAYARGPIMRMQENSFDDTP